LAVEILLHHRDQLKAWVPEDPRTRQLQALVEERRRLVGQRVRTSNRLIANLKGYFPQALACFEGLDSVMACDFLTRWPSLGEAKWAREETLRAFFHKHNVRGEERIAERIARLEDAMALTSDAGVIVPALQATRTLVAELRTLIDGALALVLPEISAPEHRGVGRHVDPLLLLGQCLLPPTTRERQKAPCGDTRALVQMAAHPLSLLQRSPTL
jgi:hypothetical protein